MKLLTATKHLTTRVSVIKLLIKDARGDEGVAFTINFLSKKFGFIGCQLAVPKT